MSEPNSALFSVDTMSCCIEPYGRLKFESEFIPMSRQSRSCSGQLCSCVHRWTDMEMDTFYR